MLKLEFSDSSRSVWLVGPTMKLGSAKSCDLVIVDDGVANTHCVLRINNDGVVVEPVDNSPCFINTQLVNKSSSLSLGDTLKIGQTSLSVVKPRQASNLPKANATAASRNQEDASGWMLQGMHNMVQNKRYPIDHKMVLGRAKECDLHFSFERLSRRHAELKLIDGNLIVEDLDSSNGTFHNGKRIKRATLIAGDEVTFDKLNFTVLGNKDQSSESMAWDNSLNQTVVRSAITPSMMEKGKQETTQPVLAKQTNKVNSAEMIQPGKLESSSSGLIIGSLVAVLLALVAVAFFI